MMILRKFPSALGEPGTCVLSLQIANEPPVLVDLVSSPDQVRQEQLRVSQCVAG